MKYLSTFFTIFLIFSINALSSIYHVKIDGSDENSGLTWNEPFLTLQKALDMAEDGDQIWVAEGIYKPTYDYGLNIGEQGKHFKLKPGVGLFGGFSADGVPTFEDRDHYLYQTILCGDLNDDDYWNESEMMWENREDNCFHVFYMPDFLNLNAQNVLDGFVIRNGHALKTDENENPFFGLGGGIFIMDNILRINNCIFKHNFANYGGAIGVFHDSRSPGNAKLDLYNSMVIDNIALIHGGGMEIFADVKLVNCVIARNRAIEGLGGGIDASFVPFKTCSLSIYNCTITENTAYNGGGGLCLESQDTQGLELPTGDVAILNSIISGNICIRFSATDEIYGVYLNSLGEELTGKVYINYCILGDGYQSSEDNYIVVSNTSNQTPKFVGTGEHPYMIQQTSPCLDAGSSIPLHANNEPFDIRGSKFPRKLNGLDGTEGTIDIGAYEFNVHQDPVSVKEFDIAFGLYPNPATEYITITKPSEGFEPSEGSEIKIINTLGECVMTVETQHAESLQRIDVSHLPPGVYFLRIGDKTRKFVKV
ncbi:MAG: hypothetical protein CVV22_06260 [Ignavibacteriae bacterium HGW-Ignavibacteriae-1]|jgi:hypothetical protein|nr:MAG: hypothetical protein CVV22_06260 [Ignavibacteriae bacterium HGW-Ignavibacteriae-1]